MELIAAILLAGPLGYFASSRKKGLLLYLGVFAVIFPIQTYVVILADSGAGEGDDYLYFIFNALFLALGVGLNLLGSRLRERRAIAAQRTES